MQVTDLHFLKKFLKKAPPIIYKRGLDYYKQELVELVSFDIYRQNAEFIVKGTEDYKVQFYDFLTGEITALCSCPYALTNTYCKHIIAAGLTLKELLENELSKYQEDIPKTKKKLIEIRKPKNFTIKKAEEEHLLKLITKQIETIKSNYKSIKLPEEDNLLFWSFSKNEFGFVEAKDYSYYNLRLLWTNRFDLSSNNFYRKIYNVTELLILEKIKWLITEKYFWRMYNELPNRLATEPVKIGTFDQIDYALLLAGKKLSTSLKVENITFDENKAIFTVKILSKASTRDLNSHKVEFWTDNENNIYAKSDFYAKVYGLDDYTSAVLWLIYISNYKNTMLALLKKDEYIKQYAKKQALPLDIASEILTMSWNIESVSGVYKVLKINILQSKKNKYFDYVGDFVKALKKPEKEKKFINTKKEEIKNKALCFIFSFYDEIQVHPAFAKLRKDGELRQNQKLDTYWGKDNTFLAFTNYSGNITQALQLVLEYQDLYDKSLEEQFSFLKQITTLLQDYRYIYVANLNFYGDYHSISKLRFSSKPAKLNFYLREQGKSLELTFKLVLNDKEVNINAVSILETPLAVYYDNEFHIFLNTDLAHLFDYIREHEKLHLKRNYFEFYWNNILKELSTKAQIFYDLKNFEIQEQELMPLKRQIYLTEKEGIIYFQPAVVYDKTTFFLEQETLADELNDTKISKYIRDLDYEEEFLEFIASLHPKFEQNTEDKSFNLSPAEMLENMWFLEAFEKMRLNNIEVLGLKKLKSFKYSSLKPQFNIYTSSGIDWFDVKIEVKFGKEIVPLSKIKKSLLKKQNYVLLDDGSIGILPEEWIKKLEKLFRIGEIKNDKAQIDKRHTFSLEELDLDLSPEVQEEIQMRKKSLENFDKNITVPIPEKLEKILRQYQVYGIQWMNFLAQINWGGILADDMGLGKTLQVLTFLLQQKINGATKPNLIVVPTTLLFNWEDEINKFTPEMKYSFYYGTDRTTDNFKNLDIILTTYTILTRDIDTLQKFEYNYIIADESQAIKNPTTQRYRSIRKLKAKARIAMTGTPIENSTIDLYSQMSFVNPGFFGSFEKFRQNYATPIDRNRDKQISAELQRIINPFILRRTKNIVAKQLPPKTETVLHCEMPPLQRKIYDSFKTQIRQKIFNAIEEQGAKKASLLILQGLLKLRQICDSPALLNDEGDFGNESVKVQTLIDIILQKYKTNKILVYSFFVGMIEEIEKQLQVYNISYEKLVGKMSQQKRKQAVDNFQNNDKVRIFLLSLKAGGTGLNLTAADYVYLLDPWWNPAVEQQAIDRTHRIGQTKPVFAYKMICRNTIEEKILDLQEKKLNISTDIITTDENLLSKISLDELKSLFE